MLEMRWLQGKYLFNYTEGKLFPGNVHLGGGEGKSPTDSINNIAKIQTSYFKRFCVTARPSNDNINILWSRLHKN